MVRIPGYNHYYHIYIHEIMWKGLFQIVVIISGSCRRVSQCSIVHLRQSHADFSFTRYNQVIGRFDKTESTVPPLCWIICYN